MGVVIAVENVAGELEPAVHIEPVGFRQLAGDCGILVGGDHGFRTGVIAEGLRQKGLIRQHRCMDAAGEYIGARQQAGIVVHAEEIQQCRQDVRRGAVFIHHDVL